VVAGNAALCFDRNCFILTFRALSRVARLEWQRLECRVEGTLDRIERVSQFTHLTTFATLTVTADIDVAKGRELLERAEHGCLIANSLRGLRTLDAQLVVTPLT
jgi:organic hydroperoxide reductase OsmC/OhrA